MFCTFCGVANLDDADGRFCRACGKLLVKDVSGTVVLHKYQPEEERPLQPNAPSVVMVEEQPKQSSILAAETIEEATLSPMYFAVSPLKLVVMSTCTWGLYEIYWYYKNWCAVKERENSTITPIGRALFAHFFCYSLFKRIQATAESHNVQMSIAPGLLAVGWIGLTVLARLPDPYWLVTFLAVLFLVPIQMVANKINQATRPKHNRNNKFSAWNIVVVVLGGILLVLLLVGVFLPSTQVRDRDSEATKSTSYAHHFSLRCSDVSTNRS